MDSLGLSKFKYWPQISVIILLLIGYGIYRYAAYYDTRSNDAYVSANVLNISSLVSGPVTKIYIKENQKVKKGDKLIEIDPFPYRYTLQEAKAKFNIAKLNEEHAQQLKAANEMMIAQAGLDQANYLLNHTTLIAPQDGYITNFNVQIGHYVEKGQGLFALVETKQWWIVTHYRETAIRLIKPGDKAKIRVDMYPGVIFHGHVNSMGWGINRIQAGNMVLSPLPYVEATEGWVRIAQRFPVRIDIDDVTDEYPLRVGASATTITYR